MKKILITLAVTVMAVVMTACSSLDVATTFNNQKLTAQPNATSLAHINADIWGIYLFNLPLFSGSSKQPGRCAIFTDTVCADNVVSMLTKKASTDFEATAVTDLSTERTSCPLPFGFNYRDIQASGNVIR